MTNEHTLIATLSTLLIVGLLIYLRGKFHLMAMSPDERIVDLQHEYDALQYYIAALKVQPKRRKYRDNK